MNKKKIILPILASIVTLVLLVGISYAYFSATITENNKTETVIKTNELNIVFTGTNEINVDGIVPGDSFTKTFTVENTSSVETTYNIYMEGITNEFNEDLVYTLSDEEGTVITEEVLPSINSGKNYLITDISIDSEEIKTYTMKVEFKYSDEDQNKLQGASFKATLGVDTTPIKIVKVVNDKLELDTLNSGDTVTKTFSVKNLSSVAHSYDIKLSDVANTYASGLTYSLSKNGEEVITNVEMPSNDTTILENQIIAPNTKDEYEITIKYDNTTAALESYVILAQDSNEFSAKLEVEAEETDNTIIYTNKNIEAAYKYNQTTGASDYCVTGDEETCIETTCYESKEANNCASGTIINYKVNDNDTVRFHVMYDNGETMTLQSQKNTVYNVEWINKSDYATANTDGTSCSSTSCNDEGPVTILNALESATSGWSNVNNQTYTMGTTIFKTNSYTACGSSNQCLVNKFTLPERTAKARMITVQEAADLGCDSGNSTCPIWMYNYLEESTGFGGTINDTTANGAKANVGYWTMNANSSIAYFAWNVHHNGRLNDYSVYFTNYGARAVVEISK